MSCIHANELRDGDVTKTTEPPQIVIAETIWRGVGVFTASDWVEIRKIGFGFTYMKLRSPKKSLKIRLHYSVLWGRIRPARLCFGLCAYLELPIN